MQLIQRLIDGRRGLVLQGNLESAQRTPGCDVTAHHACSDYMYAIDSRGARHEILQPLAQVEHAQKIAAGRCEEQPPDGFGFRPQRRIAFAAVGDPLIQDRIRSRVVSRVCAPCKLCAYAARKNRSDRLQVEQPRQPGRMLRCRTLPQQLHGVAQQ